METFLIRLWTAGEGAVVDPGDTSGLAVRGVIDGGPQADPLPFSDSAELVLRLREALTERVRERARLPGEGHRLPPPASDQ